MSDHERERKNKIARIRSDLFALFGENNPQKRVKRLEGVLNALFSSEGLLLREAFTIKDTAEKELLNKLTVWWKWKGTFTSSS
jgi:hypothetical protein